MRATSVLRHSTWDGTLVALSFVHAAALIAFPSIAIIALGLWWNANTVSHNFIHLPFFRSRRLNAAFSLFLTLLLGFPHQLWRARHLAHHAGREHQRVKWTTRIYTEAGLVFALWAALIVIAPRGFLLVYLPGYLIGLGLCQLQGYYEHAHGTTSHYGRIYNTLFFQDGFHVEHHRTPSTHWLRLGASRAGETRGSVWPPVLRWLDDVPAVLDVLERAVLRSRMLQQIVLRAHEAAIARSLAGVPEFRRVVIIGGGLFPRTAIIMRRLWPHASITIVDRNAEHLKTAQALLGNSVEVIEHSCDASSRFDADLIVVPLAFVGDRDAFYENPPAPVVLVHDWIWRRRGEGTRVSWWLLKRVNVVRREGGVISNAAATNGRRAA